MAKRFEKAMEYTQKYKDVLLPCKWCGNKEIIIASQRTIFPAKEGWSVCCSTHNCDITATYSSVKKAVEAWNSKQTIDIAAHKKVCDEIVKQFVSLVDKENNG